MLHASHSASSSTAAAADPATAAEGHGAAATGQTEPEPPASASPDACPAADASDDIAAAAPFAGQIPGVVRDIVTPDLVRGLWDGMCGDTLPKIAKLTEERRRKIRARIAADPERRSPAWWRAYFGRIRASPFCCGDAPSRNGSPPWRATLDWAIHSEANVTKVLEGTYDARAPVAAAAEPAGFAGIRAYLETSRRQEAMDGEG